MAKERDQELMRRARPTTRAQLALRRIGLWAWRKGGSEHRRPIMVIGDALCWSAAVPLATWVRHDFSAATIEVGGMAVFLLAAVVVQAVVGTRVRLYDGRSVVGSFDEMVALSRSAGIVTGTLMVFVAFATEPHLVPLGAVAGAGLASLVLMGGARAGVRLLVEAARRPTGDGCVRYLVFGAGDGAHQVIRSMLRDPNSPYLPVGLIDDHPAKRRRAIHGIPVLGTRHDIAAIATAHDVDGLLIAIPSADAALIAEISVIATEAGLSQVKVLPSLAEIFGGSAEVIDIRDVSDDDLLGRHQIETDLEEVAAYVRGRRVLVTGAGGSIGSELCRQLATLDPDELIMLDRDESALHTVQLSIEGRGLLDSPNIVLHDIRDRIGLARVFAERRPHVVFHAAALKHLPLLERFPGEAVKTNVWGTLALLEVASANGVERFVNISTDKAANPVSVLGYSKRICERLTADFARRTARPYLSVRFGNVLGSRGSVLHAFRAQVESGGPITVTHPDVTRYFMTVEEAVHLVVQAGAIGEPGEALVLDMGEPVRIAGVARMLASRSGRSVDIEYTGLRPGEKLHEELLGEGEDDRRPTHPLISQVLVPPLDADAVQDLNPMAENDETIDLLRTLCQVVGDARDAPSAAGSVRV